MIFDFDFDFDPDFDPDPDPDPDPDFDFDNPHNSRTGIRVDSVNEVLRIDANQIDTTPRIVLAEGSNPYMDGVCRLDGGERIIIRLDTQKLLDEQDAKDLDDIADATPDPEPDPPSVAPTLIPPDDVLSAEC